MIKQVIKTKIFLMIFLALLSVSATLALEISNEPIQSKALLDEAEQSIIDMQLKNIPITRANETFQEALQQYSAQVALEETGGKASYKQVNLSSLKIIALKKTAFEAKDELEVFKMEYEKAAKEVNLSEFNEEYNQIVSSFSEERFEDTIYLVNRGYERISEIESSQTAAKIFYSATTEKIIKFFTENWIVLLVIIFSVSLTLVVFRKTIYKIRMKIKLNNLILRKGAINNLIKEIQKSYFKSKKTSEGEYRIRLKKYTELIREIDRQIMVIKEETIRKKNIGRRF